MDPRLDVLRPIVGVEEAEQLVATIDRAQAGDTVAMEEFARHVEWIGRRVRSTRSRESQRVAAALLVATRQMRKEGGGAWRRFALEATDRLFELVAGLSTAHEASVRRVLTTSPDGRPIGIRGGERERIIQRLMEAGEPGLDVELVVQGRYPAGARQALARLLREGAVQRTPAGRVTLGTRLASLADPTGPPED